MRMRDESGHYTLEALSVGSLADALIKQAMDLIVGEGYDLEDVTSYLVQAVSMENVERRLDQQWKSRT